jgi:Protein of unknown function (DUF2764)
MVVPMSNEYFLGALLPELSIGEVPEIGFDELDQLFKDNLSEKNYAKVRAVRSLFDIFNLRAYWQGEPLDRYGNLSYADLEESLAAGSMLPEYVFTYLDKYGSNEERLAHYPELLICFYRHAMAEATHFFRYYLSLERELRLVLAAFRAKSLGRDIYKELQYEDPEEELIAQILAQKDAPIYVPPEKYEEIGTLFKKFGDQPIELQKALLEYRFNQIKEKLGMQPFSIDRVLAYMIELIMVERWQRMDKQKGLKMVESLLKEQL